MPVRYVPILRWKRGERVGLHHLTPHGRQRATPLFLLGADQYKIRPATKSRAAVPAANVFAHEVQTAWGPSPFMLDAAAVPVTGAQHPLQQIAATCAGAGLHIIPATYLGAPLLYQAAVGFAAQLGNGVCLRIDLQEATSIANWIGQWQHPVNATDLVIDFGSEVGTVANLGNALDHAFQHLHSGPAWRSITMAGTSMPENFTGYMAGLHIIPRREWTLWQHLNGIGLPYQLGYGDFTATSPGAPPPGIAWGYPINVKYTLPDSFLVCRGVGTTGPQGVDPATQLAGHAFSIMNYPNRHPLVNIWADPTIDLIAMGGASPQGLEHWVQLSVNRHIELVATILP
jgi:hypothetical protein